MQRQFEAPSTVDAAIKSSDAAPGRGSSASPSRRHKSPEPKILEAVDFFEGKHGPEGKRPPAQPQRIIKTSKVRDIVPRQLSPFGLS